MAKKRLRKLHAKDAPEFFNQVMVDQPLLPFLIPLGLFAWFVERWVVPFSNWVPLAAAVWVTIQYGRFKRKRAVEDLNKRWKHLILNTTPTTPIEPCGWLNKLLTEVWPNYLEPKLSRKFQYTVERGLKNRKPKLIQVMNLGFYWNSNQMSVMFLAKLAKLLIGTARIVAKKSPYQGRSSTESHP